LDVKDYISSGILDSYVLGSASEMEIKEVECLAMIYPEIKGELHKLEMIFEKFARESAVEPPPDLKLKILSQLDNVKQIPADAGTPSELKDRLETKRTIRLLVKIAVDASIALLLAVGGLWIRSEQVKNDFQQRLTNIEIENRQLKNVNNILSHQATKKINLSGTNLSPESAASVYWNTETSEVYLKVNLLPTPGADNQYQLWAIVDSKPIDMGVFEMDYALENIQKMPYLVKNAMAFAITLEKKGGNPTPTLSAMYVIGNV